MDSSKMTDKQLVELYSRNYEKGYDNVSHIFDRFLDIIGDHNIPPILDSLKKYEVPKEAKILEAGCGTGNIGRAALQAGYADLEGFEPSAKMIEEAKKKNVFKKIIQGFLTVPEEMPKEYEGAFDVVFSVGVFLHPNHAYAPAYECLLYAAKKGGLIMVSTDEFDQTPGEKEYRIKREAMEKEGKWELLEERQVEKYQGITKEIAPTGRYSTLRTDTFTVYRKL